MCDYCWTRRLLCPSCFYKFKESNFTDIKYSEIHLHMIGYYFVCLNLQCYSFGVKYDKTSYIGQLNTINKNLMPKEQIQIKNNPNEKNMDTNKNPHDPNNPFHFTLCLTCMHEHDPKTCSNKILTDHCSECGNLM